MESIAYGKIIKQRASLVAMVVLVVVAVGLLITVVQPFKYRASVQLLVIENTATTDAFSATRSAETINTSLAHLVYTTSFATQVLQNVGLQNSFPADLVERQKEWEKTIVPFVVTDTGLLKIDIYHTDRNQALMLAQGAANALSQVAKEYTGSNNISIQTVDQPMVSRYFAQPNILLNLGVSVLLGLLLSLAYIILTYRERQEFVIPVGGWKLPKTVKVQVSDVREIMQPIEQKEVLATPMKVEPKLNQPKVAEAVKVEPKVTEEVNNEVSLDNWSQLWQAAMKGDGNKE
ncbi:MAG: hypothetical protein NTY61_02955 [Candidatus Parcubacteria bacterium]|nr:hypothetical protein [Candidatus Parcubacteria bacterium]